METLEKKKLPGSPAWEALLLRAEMALDEAGLAAYNKKKADLAKKLERNMEERGMKSLPYDFYMVQEVLVEYDRCGKFGEALRNCGGSESECLEARSWDMEIKLVWDFVKERIKARMAARAVDIAQEAQDGLRQLVTDESCKLDAKAIKMALESVAPDLYGGGGGGRRTEAEGEDARRKLPMSGGVTINVVGDAAAKLLLEPKAGEKSGGVFIDV